MWLSADEIFETMRMIEEQHLDIRTVTLGVSLYDCCASDMRTTCERMVRKLLTVGQRLVPVADEVAADFGIPIVNRRVAVSPVSQLGAATGASDYLPLALALERVATELGVDFVAGFSAVVHKGMSLHDQVLLDSLPAALNQTQRVCASVSVASTQSGINMDAVRRMGDVIHQTAHLRPELAGLPCGRLVVFCNQPADNPFVAGALHGPGEPDVTLNVGVSGPGVVRAVVERIPDAPLEDLADAIKQTAFKITRMGELAGREVSRRLGVPFGIVDLSLAPTPARGDSVAEVLEAMGLDKCGGHGTTAALALLNDAVKKGGAMASSHVGGLSGAFIPLTEDAEMARSAELGALGLDKLEALTAVCSVGLDMVALPGDTPPATIASILADEMAIGMVNHKTTACRLIPVPGKTAGEWVDFGGLLGSGPIIGVNRYAGTRFVSRGGRIPGPIQSLKN